MYEPIPGNKIFEALHDHPTIVMACNTRITKGTIRGILNAAKKTDSPVLIELAKSECDINRGYTGHTPESLAKDAFQAAKEAEYDIWALHADHIGIKTGTPEELDEIKKLVKAQIDAGFTSFAIDASHLFDINGKTEKEQLKDNIRCTTEIAKFIEKNMQGKEFGLEVEVGEVGKKDSSGLVITSPEEAVAFISTLKENGVNPQVIAIANGSSHGNIYDANGNPIEQVTIDIPKTKAVVAALKKNGFNVRVAQHGITGTPLGLITTTFPHGDIIKGNVGTYWQNIYYDMLRVYNPGLYQKIWDWVMQNFKKPEKKDIETFGKYSKKALIQFFDEIYAMDTEFEHDLESMVYAHALMFFRAFKSEGYAGRVRELI
ncbi:class II fructose-bisphosphate aldolase [Candidatus Woesearchaeota archaeon]|nr:class II fructose-bisphosphate aldolase [Candidatus Woesearchaeota archaeon]